MSSSGVTSPANSNSPLSDLSRAIICLSDPSASENVKSSAFQYLENLKSDKENIWSLCMNLIMQHGSVEEGSSPSSQQHQQQDMSSLPGISSNETRVLFWCFQVLSDFFQNHIAYLSQINQLEQIQNALMQWISKVGIKYQFQSFVRTKYAVTVSLLFKLSYPQNWSQFFPQLFSQIQSGHPLALDYFIRILKSIDEEVVQRMISRSWSENDRNQLIKDHMRDDSIENIARALFMILQKRLNEDLTNNCLEVVPNYADWAPIELFTTEEFANLYLELIKDSRFRIKTCACLAQIALKGMKLHEDKLALFQKLKYIELLTTLNVDSEKDPEFAASFSQLAATTASQLYEAWNYFQYESAEKDANKIHASHSMLMQVQPLMFKLLSDDDEQISCNILSDYMNTFIGTLRQRIVGGNNTSGHGLTAQEIEQLQTLFQVAVTKSKYPNDFHFNVDDQNEYDVGFLEYREELTSLYSALVRTCPEKVKEWLYPLLNQTVQHYSQMHWTQIEVILTVFSLTVLNMTPESSNAQGNFFPPAFSALVKSDISKVNHPAVQYAFFNVYWRCSNYVAHDTSLIKPLLEIFVDERGMKNPVPMVQSRARYLFLSFMKVSQNELAPYMSTVYDTIRESMQFELQQQGVDPHSTVTREKFNLYEAIGSLLASPNADTNTSQHIFNQIVQPLLDQITQILNQRLYERDTEQVPAFQTLISDSLGGIMFVTKAFPSKGKSPLICSESKKVLVVVKQLLHQIPSSSIVRAQITTYLRTVSNVFPAQQVMEDILPLLETFQQIATDATSTQEFIDLLQPFPFKMRRSKSEQLDQSFRNLVSSFIYPLTEKVFGYLVPDYWNNPSAEVHVHLHKLHKSYLIFLEALIAQSYQDVLTTDSQKLQNLLQGILQSLQHSSAHLMRSALGVLKGLVAQWAGKNQAFTQFCFQQMIPTFFTLPVTNKFNLDDGSWFLVMGDVVDILRQMGKSCGNSFVEYLMKQVLPSLQLSQDAINHTMSVLSESKKSVAQKYLLDMSLERRKQSARV